MDASQIGIVATSLGVAKDIAKAMVGVRDFNLVAEKVAALNDQLLKAQDALLAHNTAMFELLHQHFETREELRKLKEAMSERARYTLVDVGNGFLAYRVDVAPDTSRPDQPSTAQAPYYVCQGCYDNGRKLVLQPALGPSGERSGYRCPGCGTVLLT